jgi:hypothetical protein
VNLEELEKELRQVYDKSDWHDITVARRLNHEHIIYYQATDKILSKLIRSKRNDEIKKRGG